jgi:HK97 family phage prohead protease
VTVPEIARFERTFPLEDIEITRGGDGRTVTAYAAVFDQDSEITDQHGHYIERIDKGAFAKTLTELKPGKVKVLYNHGYDADGRPNMLGSVPIGTPLEIKADGRGLLTVTRYNDSEMADAVLAAIRGGQITGQSFRGMVYQSRKQGSSGGLPLITRTELGLREYGPTASPAYEGAGILAVRAQLSEDPAFVELLRTIVANHMVTSNLGAGQPGHPTVGPATSEPGSAHSGRLHARRNALRVRSILTGVSSGEAPQRGRDRGRAGDLP